MIIPLMSGFWWTFKNGSSSLRLLRLLRLLPTSRNSKDSETLAVIDHFYRMGGVEILLCHSVGFSIIYKSFHEMGEPNYQEGVYCGRMAIVWGSAFRSSKILIWNPFNAPENHARIACQTHIRPQRPTNIFGSDRRTRSSRRTRSNRAYLALIFPLRIASDHNKLNERYLDVRLGYQMAPGQSVRTV